MKTLVPPDERAWLEVSAWEYWKIGLEAVYFPLPLLLCSVASLLWPDIASAERH